MLYFGMSYQFDMMSDNLVVYKGTKFTEYEDIEQEVEEEKSNFSILWDKALGAVPYIASYAGGLLTGFANSFLPIDFFDYSERSDAFRAGLRGGDILGAAVGMALFDAGSGGMVVGTTVVCTGVGAPVGVAIDAGSALAMGFGGLMMFNSARNVANPNRYKGSSSSSSGGSGASGGGGKNPPKNPISGNMKNRVSNKEVTPPKTRGNAPVSKKDNRPIEIHHEGQNPKGPFSEKHASDHRYGDNYKKNHPDYDKTSKIDRKQFKKDKKEYWENEWDGNRWGDK